MKKLPTYIGVIIFVVTLLINWLLPSLAKVLNTFFIWTIVACLLYTMNNAETARHIHEATHSLFKHHSQVSAL